MAAGRQAGPRIVVFCEVLWGSCILKTIVFLGRPCDRPMGGNIPSSLPAYLVLVRLR